MAMNDPLGDLLTRIRNAQMRRKGKVQSPGSQLRAHVLDVLASEGYIRGYSTTEYGNGRTEFEIELKYYDGQPVIREIQRVSKPGRRVYAGVGEMPQVANGLGITIMSTPKG
ncbi:MAG TPA: 30S ribosomal protein S8, partial [Methylovirgula sp.]